MKTMITSKRDRHRRIMHYPLLQFVSNALFPCVCCDLEFRGRRGHGGTDDAIKSTMLGRRFPDDYTVTHSELLLMGKRGSGDALMLEIIRTEGEAGRGFVGGQTRIRNMILQWHLDSLKVLVSQWQQW